MNTQLQIEKELERVTKEYEKPENFFSNPYWKGVKVGLETALHILKKEKNIETLDLNLKP